MWERYKKEIRRYPLLSREEESKLSLKCVVDSHKLITSNLKYVIRIANKYTLRYPNIDNMELIQEGNMGMMRAVETFEPNKGFRFITYADKWIEAYMQDFVAKNVNISSGCTRNKRKQLFLKNQGKTELWTDTDIDSYEEDNIHVLKYECTTEEKLTEKRWLKSVHIILDDVSERDKFIVENRLISYTPMTLKEMGNQLNISTERARQVELALKNNLKKRFEANKGIMEFIRG